MKKAAPYIINLIFCALLTVAVVFLRGVTKENGVSGIMRCLSDGFFVSGVASLVGAAFTFVGRQGLLDAVIFTFKRIWVSLHDKAYRESNRQTYAEYRESKRVKSTSYAHLWIIGAAFVIIGIIFMILFYKL